MHTIALHTCRKSIRFRCWSRKNYAVFGSLHRHVTIGRVCKGIADSALDKAKTVFPPEYREQGTQTKAEEEEMPENAGMLQWAALWDRFSLWVMAGSVAGSEVHAEGKFYDLSFIKEEWQSSLMCICKDTGRLLCHSSSFYLYHYGRKTGKENNGRRLVDTGRSTVAIGGSSF